MKKETDHFWKTILISIVMLAAVDITVGVVADKLMAKLPYSKEDLAKDNYRLHQLNSDVVIIGSSRGCNHYVTPQLSDSLDTYFGEHLSVYNAAIAGKTANSNSCAAEIIISRFRPRLVIYDLSESQLCNDNQVADIEFSAPFYWTDTIVHRYLDEIGLKERILMKSSMYRYSGKLLRILSCYMSPSAVDDGYKPMFGTNIDTTKTQHAPKVSKKAKELDAYTVNNFKNVLNKYKSEKVPLVIVCSPHFRPNGNNKRLAALCDKYDIPFMDFYEMPYFNSHPELFYNGNHMNDDGAHAFTALFFEKLKPFLQKRMKTTGVSERVVRNIEKE